MTSSHPVYLVGAGPGDPGLITVKGFECLKQADVVVYDYLVNFKFLDQLKEGARTIYVGKRAGSHTLHQDEINKLLITLWEEGNCVVRLKGGDPFIFGRGGEEALALEAKGIPFEVVPGITAGLAGLAYAGIPNTHRGLSVCTTLITGHEDPKKKSYDLDLGALAKAGGTLVFYMGVHNLPALAKGLLEGGRGSDTPVAMVRKATMPEQTVLTSTLGKVVEDAKAAGITPPTLIVVGQVVNLHDKLNWFERLPLFGKRIVITRPREQSTGQRRALEALGAQVIEHAAIKIQPPADYRSLDRAIEKLDTYSFMIFTSVNGVDHFFKRLHYLGHDARKLGGCRVCVVGPGTEKALEEQGIKADLVPPRFTSAHLAPALREKWDDLEGKNALLPRADIAPDLLLKDLEAIGMKPESITAYCTVPAEESAEELKASIEAGEIHAATFASSSAANNFVTRLGADFLSRCKGKMRFISIGPVTTKTLTERGFPPEVEAEEHTIAGLTKALIHDKQK